MRRIPWREFQSRLPRENGWEDSDLCSKERKSVETDASFYAK